MANILITDKTAKALDHEAWYGESRGQTLERLWNTYLRQFWLEHSSGASSLEADTATSNQPE